jgi:hypothetical protein
MIWKTKGATEQQCIIHIYESNEMGGTFLVQAARGVRDCGKAIERISDFQEHIMPALEDEVFTKYMSEFPDLKSLVSVIFESINKYTQSYFKERDGCFVKPHTFLLYLVRVCLDACTGERQDSEQDLILEILDRIKLFCVKTHLFKHLPLKELYTAMEGEYAPQTKGWAVLFAAKAERLPGRVTAAAIADIEEDEKAVSMACE